MEYKKMIRIFIRILPIILMGYIYFSYDKTLFDIDITYAKYIITLFFILFSILCVLNIDKIIDSIEWFIDWMYD